MGPKIITLKEKKLVGICQKMNLENNTTGQLWGRFGPKINAIENRVSEDKISMQLYDFETFGAFNPTTEFVKWATVAVSDFDEIPAELHSFVLKSGDYAVFDYKGSSENAPQFFGYIYGVWLPNSEYQLDDRPHFEVLGEKYKNNDPNSEEEIWIPVKKKI